MTTWINYYIFTENDHDEILINKIRPVIQYLKEQSWIDGYFFIRYNEGGNHIRLRIKAYQAFEDQVVHLILLQFSGNAYRLVRSDYLPETARYGGVEVLPIAEKYFDVSSETCLAILEERPNDILSRALILHLAMAKSMTKDISKLVGFFDRYTKNWLHYSGLFSEDTPDAESVIKKYFEPNFRSINENESLRLIYQRLGDGSKTGIDWLDIWVTKNSILLSEIDARLSEESFFDVIESLLHMTNNRLGIHNYHESYLSFLAKRYLETYQ